MEKWCLLKQVIQILQTKTFLIIILIISSTPPKIFCQYLKICTNRITKSKKFANWFIYLLIGVVVCTIFQWKTIYVLIFRRTSSFESRHRCQQPKITNFGYRSIEEADSTTPVGSQVNVPIAVEQTQNLQVPAADLMVFVDVKIEGRMFRVPVLLSQVQTNTIGWLAEQAANKYARWDTSNVNWLFFTYLFVLR